jgi:hypothetical protein
MLNRERNINRYNMPRQRGIFKELRHHALILWLLLEPYSSLEIFLYVPTKDTYVINMHDEV